MKTDYALTRLDFLITDTLHPNKGIFAGKEACDGIKKEVLAQKERIRILLMKHVFSVKSEKMYEELIQQYQSSLIRLLAIVTQYQQEDRPAPESTRVELFHLLVEIITELLRFIETYFSKYFDLTQFLPLPYLKTRQQEWKAMAGKWTCWAVDEETGALLQLVLKILNPYFVTTQLTYQQAFYFQTLIANLQIPEDPPPGFPFLSALEAAFLYFNFNDAFFGAHWIKTLSDKLEAVTNAQKKEETLLLLKTLIHEQRVKPNTVFRPHLPGLKETLVRWIDFQLAQLSPPTPNSEHMSNPQVSAPKVNLAVSVAMLGMFLRLLTEEEIITNPNKAELVRFFATHCATPRQPNISSESLYGSYFKPQPGTIRMMQECLSRLQHLLATKF